MSKSTTVKDAISSATKNIKSKRPKTVEIVAIIDRSGSMSSIQSDAIGAFNSFIEAQQKQAGKANLTVVLFDDKYEVLQDGVALSEAVKFDDSNFTPRGMTAMNDAIGKSIQTLKAKNTNGPAIVCILTDGQENCSTEYNNAQIKELITSAQKDLKWEFVFLAANQDAVAAGAARGIIAANSLNFAATGDGIRGATQTLGGYVSNYRNNNS